MILGPNLIYQCPSCESLIKSSSLISGNTFGAKRFSDNKVESPRMPNLPNLIRCECKNFIWLFRSKPIGEYEYDEEIPLEWTKATYAKPLTLFEYLEFLDLTQNLKVQDELYVRMKVLWSFNDRVRQNRPHFNTKDEEMAWSWNIGRLLKLMDWSKSENRLLASELMRYLEKWEFAIEILNSINDAQFQPFCSKVMEKCNEKSIEVFQF